MEFYVEPGYEKVASVLQQALEQTQSGKGKERHATVEPFTDQKIMHGARLCGLAGMSYQVFKKVTEAQRQAEGGNFKGAYSNLQGAIIYAAAQYIRTMEMEEESEGSQEESQEESVVLPQDLVGPGLWAKSFTDMAFEQPQMQRPKVRCPKCHGTKREWDNGDMWPCGRCNGTGQINE